MCAMMQKFRMNLGSIFLVYQCSQLRAGFEWPARSFGGPAALERATHAWQKPCRINNQFATIRMARQPARSFKRNAKLHGERGKVRLGFRTVSGWTPSGPYGLVAGVAPSCEN